MKKELTEAEIKRKQRKKKIRKRRFFIFIIVLFIGGIVTLGVLLKTKLFPIKKVAVDGSEIYSKQEIIKASGINSKTPIMSITENSVKNNLQKRLPYIETVKIKRSFPDAVKLTVTDATEAFAFKSGNEAFIVSDSLRVLTKVKTINEKLISVSANDLTLKTGREVSFKNSEDKELFDLLYTYITEKKIKLNSIDLTDHVHITVFVEDRFEVNLGANENIREKIDHLGGMIKEIGERKGKINLEMWSKTDSKGTFIAEK